MSEFKYDQAFDRNLGWLETADQEKLQQAHAAVVGCGGTGGFQAQVLARLGIGKFTLVDPDIFEISNMNRQLGAASDTLGRKKVEVIRGMISAINPLAEIKVYEEPFDEGNADQILKGVQVAVDGIDFFQFEAKLHLFQKCRNTGTPVITSAPVGFGASLLVFGAQSMDPFQYFDIHEGMSKKEKGFNLAFGLSPTPLCLSYMSKNQPMDFEGGRASSVCPALMLAGAITGTEVTKILTGKGKVYYAPNIFQIDLLAQKAVRKYYPLGMKSPWMKLKKSVIKKFVLKI